MNKTKNFKKIISSLLAAVLLVFAVVTPQIAVALTNSEKSEIGNINHEINGIRSKIEKSENKIKSIEEKKSQSKETILDLYSQVNELDRQINNYNKQINLLNTQLDSLKKQIKDTEEKIAIKQKDVDEAKEILSERLRTLYMAGETSSIEILLSADSFESFLTRMELVQNVSKHDSALIDDLEFKMRDLKKLQTSLKDKQVTLESNKDKLASAKAELVPKKRKLDASVAEMNRKLNHLNSESADAKKVQQKLESQKKAFNRRIDSILSGRIQNGSGTTGAMIWPLPYRGTYITSRFGWRTLYGKPNFHRGLDISMPGGYTWSKQLVAVADGTVKFTSNNGSYNGGYGNYLAIDHGNGVQTRYGHCYSVLVSRGQRVKQGQPVAIMGTTGNSTGPHVHFEVIINGVKKDPEKYLSRPSDVYYR